MAKRHKSNKKKRSKSVRHDTSYFKTSDAKTFDQYILALIITGAFTGIGTIIGSFLGKYILKEAEKTLPVNESFSAAAKSI